MKQLPRDSATASRDLARSSPDITYQQLWGEDGLLGWIQGCELLWFEQRWRESDLQQREQIGGKTSSPLMCQAGLTLPFSKYIHSPGRLWQGSVASENQVQEDPARGPR